MNHLEKYIGKENLEKIKNCDDIVLKSSVLVRLLFQERYDESGAAYIGHLERVAKAMTTPEGQALGFLHDTVEDIDGIEFQDLADIGIPPSVIEALRLVTHPTTVEKILSKEEKLSRYNKEINRIIESGNALALELKIADMSDNYNPKRLRQCSEERQEWFQEKYGPQLKKLLACKKERSQQCETKRF